MPTEAPYDIGSICLRGACWCDRSATHVPLRYIKKRMQASENRGTLSAEARLLGMAACRYRGFTLKCGFVALNGALFNSVYVAVRRLLRMRVTLALFRNWEREATGADDVGRRL